MKTAVVLLNLWGPDRPESVKRFLFNLFNDPLIIRLPGFLRTPLAWLISTRRNKEAQAIYSEIGGKSPTGIDLFCGAGGLSLGFLIPLSALSIYQPIL